MKSESQGDDSINMTDREREVSEVVHDGQNDVGENHEQNFRKTVYLTIAVYASVFCLGLVGSVIGPSLLDLQELYQITTSPALIIVPCIAAGYLTGSLVGGYLFSKLNDTFYFLLGSSGMAIGFSAVLWIPNYPVVCAVMTLTAVFEGLSEVASHVFIMTTWRANRHLESLTMIISVVWSIGSFLGPIILEPFLSERSQGFRKDGANVTDIASVPTGSQTNIRYGWLVISLVCCMAVALTGTSFFWNGREFKKRKVTTANAGGSQRQTKLYKVLVSLFAVCLYFFYMCIEQSLGSLLTVYVVDGLMWEKYKGPLITSVYWALFGLSQVVAVFLTKIVSPLKIILVHFVFVSIALLVLSVTAHVSETAVWVCVAVVGYSEGPFFHCGYLLIDKYLPMDGWLSAIIVCTSCGSSMINIPLLGHIFTTYGSSAMTFTLLGYALSVLVSLCLLPCVIRRYQRRQEISSVEVIEERVVLNNSA